MGHLGLGRNRGERIEEGNAARVTQEVREKEKPLRMSYSGTEKEGVEREKKA